MKHREYSYEFDSMQAAVHTFLDLLNNKLESQQHVESTNEKVKDSYKKEIVELTHLFYTINDSSRLMINNPHFKQHDFWSVSEIMTEMLAIDPPLMDRYKPEIMEWSYKLKPDRKARYLYGMRWSEFNQLFNTYEKFKRNPNTKKAFISIYTPYDTNPEYDDVPCTTSYHFLMRDGVMDMTTFFRSHDIMSGMKYDALLSGFVLNSLCSWLRSDGIDAKPGKLHFFDGSLHYYPEKDGDKIKKALSSFGPDNLENKLTVVKDDMNPKEFFDEMHKVLKVEGASYWNNAHIAAKHLEEMTHEPMKTFAKVYFDRNKKWCEEEYGVPR